MFDFAIESMQAQINSKFGQELDKLWQTVIDFRDTELANETNFKIRYRKVKDFFDKNVARTFIDLVWKHVGLWVNKIKYTELWESGFCTATFINDGSGRDQSGLRQIDNMLNAGNMERYFGTKIDSPMSAETLIKMATSYDKIKGAISRNNRDEIMKLVSCYIGFDVRTGFLLEDFLPKNSGVSNFTARELTSLMLHELGHTLTLIEHAADLYAHSSSFSYLTNAFSLQNSGNEKAAQDLASILIAEAEKNKMPGVVKSLKAVSNKMRNACSAAGASADPVAKSKAVRGFMEVLFAAAFDILEIPSHLLFGSPSTFRFSSEDQKKKFGDLPLNARYITWQERKADEYAATHGYAADVVTAIDKLSRLFSRLGKTPAQIDKLNACNKLGKNISFLTRMKLALYAPALMSSWGHFLYPEGSKRFKEILMETVQMLKNNAADPEYVEFYLKQIESIIEVINHPDDTDEAIARITKRYQLFAEYLAIPSLFDALVHGRLKSELEVLIDDIQKLSGNLLAYYGFKLSSLAKKG